MIETFLLDLFSSLSNDYNVLIVIGLASLLGVIAYIDFKTYKIPNKLNIGIVLLRLLLIPFIGIITPQNLLSSVIGFLFFLIPAMIVSHKMGGDIKCITALGLFFNLKLFIAFLLISTMLSLGIHILMKAQYKVKILPFAPFFFATHLIFSIIFLLN